MRLTPGTTLGRYVIEHLVGVGGMGEVYRGHDTQLSRTVAVKTIAAGFLNDRTAEPRFGRERDIAVTLEHPHICRLLDAGRDGNVEYVVLEYLEGQTLAARLARGPVPLAEAIGYAIEMADALDYAHRRGIVHRDLKPGNVMLTATGIKLLDFGLATYRRTPASPAPAVHTQTTLVGGPTADTLLGTTPYLAPERLEGSDGDHRIDVFTFGVVLYEMVAGRRPFDGSSPAAVIAATLAGSPAPLGRTDRQGEEFEWLVRTCMARNPNERWQSMGDVARVLKRIARRGDTPVDAPARRSRSRWAVAAAVALLLAGIGAAQRWSASRSIGASVAFEVAPPPGGLFTPSDGSVQTPQLSVSPEGEQLAFVASGVDGVARIWLRPLQSVAARPLAGSENAMYPFWSPDGRSMGFFADGMLKRVDLAGGPARALAAAPNGRGGSWNADGVILFSATTTGVVYSVPAEGGTPVARTRLQGARGDTSHRWPHFLPDGRRFLYFARSELQSHEGIYMASLDDADTWLVTNSNFGAVYLEPEWVIYIGNGMLLARAVDLERRRPLGDPVVVAEQVSGSSTFYPAVSVSRAGVLAYAKPGDSAQLDWVDRSGARLMTALPRGRYVDFRLSPDDRLLALSEVNAETDRSDIFVLDFTRGTRVRVTSARSTDASVTWSPDGKRLAFRSNRQLVHDLYTRTLSTMAPEQVFLRSSNAKYPTAWSPDGTLLVYHTMNADTAGDIWAAPVDEPGKAFPLVKTPFNETDGQLSSDGRWIAYTSNETGASQVYVQAVGSNSPRWQVSRQSGLGPKWAADGAELFYVSGDTLMAVPIARSGEPGVAQPLFRFTAPPIVSALTTFDVARDGRFLVRVPLDDIRSLPFTVVTGWAPSGRQ